MTPPTPRTLMIAIAITLALGARVAAKSPDADGGAYFESRIRPILVDHCYKCHSEEKGKRKGGLLLDRRAGWEKGGESGSPAIDLENPEESLLVKMVRHDPDYESMPPKSKLSEVEIANLVEWIERGAPDPRDEGLADAVEKSDFDLEERRTWWSLQPLAEPDLPAVDDFSWPRNSFDQFVLAALEAKSWKPAPPASRATLLRRASVTLTGLAPSPDELASFIADGRPDAYERQVDRLLASPHFGERWARHWMDVVRYADSKAFERDYTIPYNFEYRDYLIRAFNDDVPFDQFVREAFAGDLLPAPRLSPESGRNESVVAPGFILSTDGQHGPPDIHGDEARIFDAMINTATTAFQGLTVACARCHDHKFDAITAADYYSLYGMLRSSRLNYANSSALSVAHEETLSHLADKKRALTAAIFKHSSATGAATTDSPLAPGGTNAQQFDWTPDGPGIQVISEPTFVIDTGSPSLIRAGLGRGVAGGQPSARLDGTLRTQDFVIDGNPITLWLRGRGAAVNLIVRNYELAGRGPTTRILRTEIESDTLQKISIQTTLWKGETAYLEILHQGTQMKCLAPDEQHPPLTDGAYFLFPSRLDPAVSTDPEDLLARARAGNLAPGEAGLLGEYYAGGIVAPDLGHPEISRLVSQIVDLEKQLPVPRYVRSLTDGTRYEQAIFVRGNHKQASGSPNPRRFLDAFGGQPIRDAGSGRLAYAEHLLTTSSALTARVRANRIWMRVFGRGLVASVDDFGKMGELPSHPELLDHLAQSFVGNGWSTKALLRELLNSQTFRMVSTPGRGVAEGDPKNVLLQHMPLQRMDAESIRDHILQVSGTLDTALFGPNIRTNIDGQFPSRAMPKKNGPLDGAGRRSIYQEMRRNFLPSFQATFDLPNGGAPTGQRASTNVPAQSLTLLNHPFVHDQAGKWATHTLSLEGDAASRIDYLHQQAFSRPATPEEIDWGKRSLKEFGIDEEVHPAWTALCHVMINRKEFIYVF